MEKANIVIIGGGIIGLAIAAKLSQGNEGVFVFEKNNRIGQEVSGHNSGVIHSGIHYPRNSLKARLSVLGNEMIYRICEENKIPCKRLGKITVAKGDREMAELSRLKKQGEENGVPGLELLDGEAVRRMEPNVVVDGALHSPSTGIIEPDDLISFYRAKIGVHGGFISTGTEVTSIRKSDAGYVIEARSLGDKYSLVANTVVNSAGLHSDKVAAMAGLDIDRLGYRLHYCKGDYFRISGEPPVRRLVYPVPKGVGLGIHLTPDMAGSIKMGPNAYYVDEIDYKVGSSQDEFREDAGRYLPSIIRREIHEDSSGIRPKLQGPNDPFRDFVIRDETDNGLPRFVNLIGMESPGLTASPAIADYVSELLEKHVR